MFVIGWDLLQPKGNSIAPIVFIPDKKKTPIMRGSFAIKPSKMSMLKAICGYIPYFRGYHRKKIRIIINSNHIPACSTLF